MVVADSDPTSEREGPEPAAGGAPIGVDEPTEAALDDAVETSEATQWKLVWWRFRKHRMAMASLVVLGFYVLTVLFAPFIAPYGPTAQSSDANYVKGPPELIRLWDGGPAFPHVDNQVTVRGDVTEGFRYTVVPIEGRKDIRWFVRGDSYSVFGLFETDWHLFGVDPVLIPATIEAPTDADGDDPFGDLERDERGGLVIPGLGGSTEAGGDDTDGADTGGGTIVGDGGVELIEVPGYVHFLGTDDLGRDQLSRIIYATRTSLTIGLAGLVMAFLLGLVFGGIAGYFGGWIDYVIQRLIEIVRSIPTIPLVMGLAAAFPPDWSNARVFFFTSMILGLVGWTTLARRIRSMLLTLRDEDFIIAARLSGASPFRVITRHMLPSFFSYIVVTLAIEFPYMILAESVLSFVGLGLRPPTVSWGVLLQEAQKVEVLEQTPWLLAPAAFVIVVILAFNFLGDGLRDAADPYQESS